MAMMTKKTKRNLMIGGGLAVLAAVGGLIGWAVSKMRSSSTDGA